MSIDQQIAVVRRFNRSYTQRIGASRGRWATVSPGWTRNAALSEAVGMYERAGYGRIARYNDNPFATHFFEKAL